MPKVNLTVSALRGLKPDPDRQIDYHDQTTTGFAVRVSPAGKKTFCVFYRMGRRLRRYTIGTYPKLSLADARDKAKKALRDAADGKDPAAEKKKERQAETFSELADLYLDKYAAKKRSAYEDRRIVERYLRPELKHVRASAVTRGQIRDILDEIARDAPIMANRVLACVRKIFNWGIANDHVEHNPCAALARPGEERRRDRVYTDKELKKIWKAAEAEDWVVADLLRLQLLTAQRVGELMRMMWSEIEGRWWLIPAERSKNKMPHRVWLSKPAVQVLDRLRQKETAHAKEKKRKASEWVFPGRRLKRPVEGVRNVQNRIRDATGIDDFRPHDLRRTAATRMAEMGVPWLTISKILNHSEPGVTAVYDRATYDADKKKALDAWARRLMAIVSELKGADSTV
jgi:integrase